MKMTLEQSKRVADNHNLIYSFLKKYNLSIDEYYDICAIALCKASIAFDETKSSFSTYAYKSMFNAYLLNIRKETAQHKIPRELIVSYDKDCSKDGIDEAMNFKDMLEDNVDIEANVIFNITMKEYFNKLSKLQSNILILALYGYKQEDIANKFNVSRNYVSKIKRDFIKHIKE